MSDGLVRILDGNTFVVSEARVLAALPTLTPLERLVLAAP
jgi:hypothetical protein